MSDIDNNKVIMINSTYMLHINNNQFLWSTMRGPESKFSYQTPDQFGTLQSLFIDPEDEGGAARQGGVGAVWKPRSTDFCISTSDEILWPGTLNCPEYALPVFKTGEA